MAQFSFGDMTGDNNMTIWGVGTFICMIGNTSLGSIFGTQGF
jgi:hypothetical protein